MAVLFFPFKQKVANDAALYFLSLCDGRINKMKLMKLMYLAERTSLIEGECPIFGGTYFSMEYGPVVSEILDALNSDCWIGMHRSHYDIIMDASLPLKLDFLSDWDISILTKIYEQFGQMSEWELSDYTHRECPEWEKTPRGQRNIILLKNVSPESGDALEEHAIEATYINNL